MPQETIPMSRPSLEEGLEYLAGKRSIGKLVRSVPPPRPGGKKDPFGALVVAIVNQQISRIAARSIEGRLVGVVGKPFVPESILGVDHGTLRGCGLSRTKADCMLACAAYARDNPLTAKSCARLTDAEIKERLCRIKGIGEWSAHMVLLFGLGRPDVMPDGDGGIVRAASLLFSIESHAEAREELVRRSAGWSPHRTLAAWFLWRSLG